MREQLELQAHVSVEDICDAVWELINSKIKGTYKWDLQDGEYDFTFDNDGRVTGMDIKFSAGYEGDE